MERILLVLVLLCSGLTVNAAEIISLQRLHDSYQGSLRQKISQAQLKQNQYKLEQAEVNDDWELFGSASASQNSELLTSTSDREYTALGGTIGLRYPLFGTLEAKENDVYIAQGAVDFETQDGQKVKLDDLYQVTNNFISYWITLHKKLASDTFLTSENDTTHQLNKRKARGLLYESDYLELLSAYSLAKRNQIKSMQEAKLALKNLSLYLDIDIVSFIPSAPYFETKPISEQERINTINQNVDIKILEIEIDTLQKVINNSDWGGIESNFSISQSMGYETNPDGDTHSLNASINLRMPLQFITHNRTQKQILKYRLNEKLAEYNLRKSELSRLITNKEIDCEAKLKTLKLQKIRLESAYNTKYRQQLRVKLVDGDVIEKAAQANIRHYVQYLDYLDALNDYLQAKALLNRTINKPYKEIDISDASNEYYNLLPSSTELRAVINKEL